MIYFVVKDKKFGSSILRGIQISDMLSQKGIDSQVISSNQIKQAKQGSILIWVKQIDINLVKSFPKNVHVYDPVDNYIYKFDKIQKLLNENLCDHLIVNNSFMKSDIEDTTSFTGNIFVIHHHWDPRISTAKKTNQNHLRFGFLGSVASLRHTDNFLHYRELINEFPIELYDAEIGKNVTNLIKNRKDIKVAHNPDAMRRLEINFNCHLSIRQNDSSVSRYKTSAKVATASALNHNIITTREKAVEDILPTDYPFILRNTRLNTVREMLDSVLQDYEGDRTLWNKGLSMISKVEKKLSLHNIILNYINLISKI